MKIQQSLTLLLLTSLLLWNACKEKTNASTDLVVKNNGDLILFGQTVSFDNLKAALLDSLTKMPSIPDTLGIQFEEEILMGMRGEVRTQVSEAIALAKASKTSPVVVDYTFLQEKGTDCDQPDTLRTNCAVINFVYPKVYFNNSAVQDSVNAWVNDYLINVLTGWASEDTTTAPVATLEEAAKAFFEIHKTYEGSVMYGAFVADCTYDVLLSDSKYLTIEINGYTFQGGAHGSPTALVATFDVTNGKQLRWDDLVTDKAAVQTLAEKQFKEVRADIFEDGFTFDEFTPFKLPDNYGLTDEGIYFHYVAYEVGPYAIGNTTFTMPYAAMGTLAKVILTPQPVAAEDRAEIETVIHDFYKWYDTFQKDDINNLNFTTATGEHLALDMPKLEQYFANLEASGFISSRFIEKERAILQECEVLWQNENKDEVPSCLDADRFFCAQDWDINFWTSAAVTATRRGIDKAKATLKSNAGGGPQERIIELQKENGRWLIIDIPCDRGI
ncbi:MAG: DUF3828 domain-containing protein [Saprospiraceae bacterium]|nr:DUF3828 domain-containing protein [Saprospiraceae bacterium]